MPPKKGADKGSKGKGGAGEEELLRQLNAVKAFQKSHAASSQMHGVEPLAISVGAGGCAFGRAVVAPHLIPVDRGGVTPLHVRALLEGFSGAYYPYLQTLAIWNVPLGDAGPSYVSHYLKTRTCALKSMELNDCGIGPLGCKALGEALEVNKSLLHLQLDMNRLGEAGASQLGDYLPCNHSLATLSLQYCGLTESAGAIIASRVMRLATLTSLNLRGNALGDAGVCAVLEAMVRHNGGDAPHPAMAHLSLADTSCAVEGEVGEALRACAEKNDLCGSYDLQHNPIGDTTTYQFVKLFQTTCAHVHVFEVSETTSAGPLDPLLYKQLYAVTGANHKEWLKAQKKQKGKGGGKGGKQGKQKKK
jgi:hypothetical protein